MHYNTHVNHEEIKNDTERTIKFKPFIKKKKDKWKGKTYPWEKDDWKKFEGKKYNDYL